MTDANFTVSHGELRERASDFLGQGLVYNDLDSADKKRIDDSIEDGKGRFYKPGPPFDGYEWTFLKPSTTISVWPTATGTVSGTATYSTDNGGESTVTVSTGTPFYASAVGKSFVFDTSGTGYEIKRVTSTTVAVVKGDASGEASGDTYTLTANGDYPLPADFAAIEGEFTFDPDDNYGPDIPVVSEGRIRGYRQWSDNTIGIPRYAGIRAVATDDKTVQEYELLLYPVPSQLYTLHYQYIRIPPRGGGEAQYPVGSRIHRDTLIAAVLAAAEERSNDIAGLWNQRFAERMAASVAFDRKLKPQRGVNTNKFSPHARRHWTRYGGRLVPLGDVTVGGVLPASS